MDPATYTDPQLTLADRLVIQALCNDPSADGGCICISTTPKDPLMSNQANPKRSPQHQN